MKILVDYDPRLKVALLKPLDKDVWHWNVIINSLPFCWRTETAAFQKFVSVVITPRHVFLFDFPPESAPVVGSRIRIFKYPVLEFIDADKVGNGFQRFCEVRVAIFIGLVAEEAVHIGIGKHLHAHGVNLAYFAG